MVVWANAAMIVGGDANMFKLPETINQAYVVLFFYTND